MGGARDGECCCAPEREAWANPRQQPSDEGSDDESYAEDGAYHSVCACPPFSWNCICYVREAYGEAGTCDAADHSPYEEPGQVGCEGHYDVVYSEAEGGENEDWSSTIAVG